MDRINLWHRANDARNLKFIVQDDDERHILNQKEILFRKENIQIWKELEYYAKHGEILGKYKTFEYDNLLKEYSAKEPRELVNMLNNIQNYRIKARQRLKMLNDDEQIALVLNRMEKYNIQEKAIKTLLKMN